MEENKSTSDFDALLDDLVSGKADPLGLVADVKPAQKKPADPKESALRQRFSEIVAFYEKNGRAPDFDSADVFESMLGSRLKTYQVSPAYAAAVADLDTHGLLSMGDGPKAASAGPAACTDFELSSDKIRFPLRDIIRAPLFSLIFVA